MQDTEDRPGSGDIAFSRLNVVVKPTNACNLACTYCYVFDRSQHAFMSDQTLERVMNECIGAVSLNGKLEVIWHGGEPSIVGVDFYRKAVSYQKNRDAAPFIENTFQTNAYALSDELIEFLRLHNFSVGASLDGPEELHNRCRRAHGGRGSFRQVFANIQRLRKMAIPCGVICVITRQNKDHIKEIYDFFHGEQIPFKINPLINAGSARSRRSYHHITPEEYADVVLELFDLWYSDGTSTLPVGTVEDIVKSLLKDQHTGCCGSMNCQKHFLAIGPTGDVYPCGRFDGMPGYHYGNISRRALHDILRSPVRRDLLERDARLIPRCRQCEWLRICHGGCMHNALCDTGDIAAPDILCRAYRKIYPRIRQTLRETIDPALETQIRHVRT